MIKDDISNIETGASCYVLNSATSIHAYKNNTRKTYSEVGGKWFLSSQSTYTSVPSNSVCWSYTDIAKLSHYAYVEPIYYSFALMFSLFILIFSFMLLFRQFFRRKL